MEKIINFATQNEDSRNKNGPHLMRAFFFTILFILTLFVLIPESISSRQAVESNELTLKINEFMSINHYSYKDPFGEHDDWLEIFNHGNDAIDLAGFFFTNDLSKPTKWEIPDSYLESTVVEHNKYIIFRFDKDPEQGPLHIDFTLKGNGGFIALFARDGATLIDSVSYKQQIPDVSYGRVGDGKDDWGFFPKPSPGKPNLDKKILRVTGDPVFSLESGFYADSITLKISTPKVCRIFYTVDGGKPVDENKLLYTSPIKIKETTVVRAIAYEPGAIQSKIITKTYFINEKVTLPVASVVSDSRNLFKKKTGIFAEKNKDEIWEKPAYFEYFNKEGEPVISMDAGIKLFGRFCRRSHKKSFVVLAKKKFGSDWINYPFFEDKDIGKFNGIIMRADATYGIDGEESNKYMSGARIKNELIYQINKELGYPVDMQAYQPVVVFINGNYWGLYNLMERKGEDFIRSNFNVSEPLDIINPYDRYRDPTFVVKRGDKKHYLSMVGFLKHNDLNDTAAYDRVAKMMDIDNFIDCWIYEVYMAKGDCNTNTRMWRPRTMEGKWRCMSYDQDHWKKHRMDMFDRLTDSKRGRNAILKELFKSDRFRYIFINRLADLVNTVFLPEHVKELIDVIDSVISAERKRDRERWKEKVKYAKPGEQIAWIKNFVVKRPKYLKQDVVEWFELDGSFELLVNVKPKEKGKIMINSIYIDTFPWKGTYFQGIPVPITAVPVEGYKFDHWSFYRSSYLPLKSTPITSNKGQSFNQDTEIPGTQSYILNYRGDTYAIQANFKKIKH